MPGSGLMALNIVGKEAALEDPFFDSEEDDAPVDMELVFEAMKHVPLPDIDYQEQDDPISGDPSISEALPGRAIRAQPDPVLRQGILKRKVAIEEPVQQKKKGGGTSRVPKRLKVELQSNAMCGKTIPKQDPKVEIGVASVTAAAAKVAAEVAPNVVTGGTVAESGPRPDFSLWTVEDDLSLKDAVEAGVAMEALAKGAIRFSRWFTVKELRERWRALLYDPEIAEQAALRMAEAEYTSNYCRPKSPVEQKNPQELARKRRANSIRTLYYKRSKKLALEDVALDNGNDVVGCNTDGACGAPTEIVSDKPQASGIGILPDALAIESVDPSSMPSKEGHSLELEDAGFSQMYSLLATGGIKAVIAAIPAGMSVNAPELEVGGPIGVPLNGVDNLLPPSGLAKLVGSKQDPTVLREENGQHSHSGSQLGEPVEAGGSLDKSGVGMSSETSATILRHSCPSVEAGLAFTVADIKVDLVFPSRNCSEIPKEEGERDVTFPREDSCKLYPLATTSQQQVNEVHEATNGVRPRGLCPVVLQDSDGKQDMSGTSSHLENRWIASVNELETSGADGTSVNLSEVKDVQPRAISSAPAVDHTDVRSGDTKVLLSSVGIVDGSTSGLNESTEILETCPSLTMDASANDEMDEAETIEALYKECCCGEYCSGDIQEKCGYGDICYCTEMDDAYDCHLSSGEECTGDQDCPYLTDRCSLQQNKLGPSILQPLVCTLSTEDTEVPDLDDSLLPPLYRYSSGSDQDEMAGYSDSPGSDAGRDDYIYTDEIVGGNPSADEEYVDISARQGVSGGRVETEINNIRDTVNDPALFRSSVDRSVGSIAMHPGNNVECVGGSLLAVEDEKVGLKCAGQATNPGLCKVSTSASDLDGPYTTPTPSQTLQQQLGPQENGNRRCQEANNFGVTEWQTSTILPVIGDRETETSPNADISVPPETRARDGEAVELGQDPIEDEVESDEEIARFSDVEAMVLDMDLDVADGDFSARAESRRFYRQHGKAVVRAEQAANAAMQRELTLRGALAILYGRHSKYYITQTEVLMGRATSDNVVDIDLGKEGRANKVSRQQAKVKLKKDGVFYLHNLGRRGLTVNNKSVEKGERAILGSNCFIEVGGMRFIFEFNRRLVQEHISGRL